MESPMLKASLVSNNSSAVALLAYLRSALPDTHCHVTVGDRSSTATSTASSISSTTPTFNMVCGTDPLTDWNTVESLLLHQRQQCKTPSDSITSRPLLLGGFGIHPWWALQGGTTTEEVRAAQEAALAYLEAKLVSFPEAAVAEIGIDTIRYYPPPPSSTSCCCSDANEKGGDIVSSSVPPSVAQSDPTPQPTMMTPAVTASLQWKLFEGQMVLASKYQRPVSIHIVGKGSYGLIDSYLTAIFTHNQSLFKQWKKSRTVVPEGSTYIQLPPTIVFHGFCGSTDFAKKILKMYPPTDDDGDVVEATTSSAPPSPPPTTRIYFGIGPNTTLRLKKVDDLIGGILAPSTTPPPSPPSPTGSLPPSCVLLESDAHYSWDGSSLSIPLQSSSDTLLSSLLELIRIMAVLPRRGVVVGGSSGEASTLDGDALMRGISYLHANANRAFASILRK